MESQTEVSSPAKETQEISEVVRIGSLSNLMKTNKDTNYKQPIPENKETKSITNDLKDLSIETATHLFKEYSKELATQKRTSLAAFFADPLIEVSNNEIVFTVGSKLVESEIIEEKSKLMEYFNSHGFILSEVSCQVNAKQISAYKLFSPKKQMEALIEKYPDLEEFSSRFYLDFE